MAATHGGGRFPTTRMSAVAGVRDPDEHTRRRSWDALVSAYWRPVYKHLRLRWRKSRPDAEDLTQAFFALALEREFFDGYDPTRAKFRTFVRLCLDRFASNDLEAGRRLKRGGGAALLSLDFDAAETEVAAADPLDPEALFDREWERGLFSRAVELLRSACAGTEREVRFVLFERYDLAEGEPPTYAALADELGLPVSTVTNHLAWARRELRRLVLERLGEVSGGEEDYDREARRLFGAERT
jgi:RNA polymerase sigma factor (sigma-70 family)